MNLGIIKKIFKEYFEVTECLYEYAENTEVTNISTKLINYILDIYNCKYLEADCMKLVDKVKCIKTTADALVINYDEIKDLNERVVFELKSKYLIKNKITYQKTFEINSFLEELYDLILKGDISACKMYAFLNLNKIVNESSIDAAFTIYQMLSYSGDMFSLIVLKKFKDSMFYDNVIKLFENVKYNCIFTLTDEVNDNIQEEVRNFVSTILAYKNREVQKKLVNLDIFILYYLVITKDSLKCKLNNLCNFDINSYGLLLRTEYFKNKEYGF